MIIEMMHILPLALTFVALITKKKKKKKKKRNKSKKLATPATTTYMWALTAGAA